MRGADTNAKYIKTQTAACRLECKVKNWQMSGPNAQDGSLRRRPRQNGQIEGKREEKGHAGSGRDRRTGWCARSIWAVGRDWGAGQHVHGRQDQTKFKRGRPERETEGGRQSKRPRQDETTLADCQIRGEEEPRKEENTKAPGRDDSSLHGRGTTEGVGHPRSQESRDGIGWGDFAKAKRGRQRENRPGCLKSQKKAGAQGDHAGCRGAARAVHLQQRDMPSSMR